jgi:enoyl-CoA hydratase/carnithine racemase
MLPNGHDRHVGRKAKYVPSTSRDVLTRSGSRRAVLSRTPARAVQALQRRNAAAERDPQPVVAAVHGVATAAGCQLAATAGVTLCSPSARLATPGVAIGLFCSTPRCRSCVA